LLTGTIGILINNIFFGKVKLNNSDWKFICLFGFCQNTLYLGLNFLAMNKIDAYLAVIVASLLPIFVAIISFFLKKDKIHFLSVIGIIVGFFGSSIILAPKITVNLNLYGLSLCLIAVIALAMATLIIKDGFSKKEQLLPFVSIQMIVGGLPLILVSFLFEEWIINFSNSFIIAFIYTCFFPGLIATMIWFNLVKRIGVIMASSFHFLTPPTGVIIAYIVLNERIIISDIIGIIFITIALTTIHQAKKKTKI
jgi:drug/metabolite transporter (DMT)-like permease